MTFNDFNKNDLCAIFPNTGIKIDTLSADEQKEYMLLNNAYRRLLSAYLIDKLNLKEYDDTFSNSDLCFVPNDAKKMDCYQWFASNELKYFYCRNNIYIERLSDENKEFLRNTITTGDYSINDEKASFIKESFPNIIKERVYIDKNGKVKKVFTLFGPNSRNYMAPHDSIVIGFNYDEFAENGLNDDEWYERHLKQCKFMCDELNKMMHSLNKESKLPIYVLKYGKYSTIKRKSD